QAGFTARLLEIGEGVQHFLARRLTLAVVVRVLKLLDSGLQRPLFRERECRLSQQVLSAEPAERLQLLRRRHLHEFLVRHAAVRRGAEPELLSEDVFERRLPPDNLDAEDRMLLLQEIDGRRRGERSLNAIEGDRQIVGGWLRNRLSGCLWRRRG